MRKEPRLLDYPLEILQRYADGNPDISEKHRESGLRTFARLRQKGNVDIFPDGDMPMDGYSERSWFSSRKNIGIAESFLIDPEKKDRATNILVHELIHTAYDGFSEGVTDVHRIRAIHKENERRAAAGAEPIPLGKSSYTPFLFAGSVDIEANKATGARGKLKMFQPQPLPTEAMIYEILENRNRLPVTPAVGGFYLKAVNCHDVDGILREFRSAKLSNMPADARKALAAEILRKFDDTVKGLEFHKAEPDNMARTLLCKGMFDRQTEKSRGALLEIAGMSKDKMAETARDNQREFKNLQKTWYHILHGRVSVAESEETSARR